MSRFRIGLTLLLVGGLLSSTVRLQAQRSEIGVGLGGSFYLGDINPKKVFHDTRFAASVFYRYNIDTRLALRFSGSYGRITASDKSFNNPRNLNFRNDLVDISALLEVNFVNFFTGSRQHRFTPYLALGAAVCFSNPYGRYYDPVTQDARWVNLRSLHTEGQGLPGYKKEYSLAQFALPFGIGFKVSIAKGVSLGLEWMMRLTFTDYLDDVGGDYANVGEIRANYGDIAAYFADPSGMEHAVGSQRGDKSIFDWYSFAMITVCVRLNGRDAPCPAYGDQKYKKRR